MKKNTIGIIFIIILVLTLIGLTTGLFIFENGKKEENTEITNTIEEKKEYSDVDFTFKFLKMENEGKNMLYSPLSIKYALYMLNDGADGETKKQIENVIGEEELTKYENIKDRLSLANSIFIRDNYYKEVKDSYKNELIKKYNAEIIKDEFKSADNVNKWIAEKTFDQIKSVLRDDIIQNPNTVMILINALALDMEWENRFDENDTYGNIFYLEDGSEIEATTMSMSRDKSDSISYYKDDEIIAVAMDLKEYEDYQMEFIAIMPEKDLSEYIENFKEEDLEKITKNMTLASETKAGINLRIPKFSFDYDLDLLSDLMAMGIEDAFISGTADFSNMSERPLFVSDAIHKANIDFSEEGVKAAAVTVFTMQANAMLPEDKPIEIEFNKPFMFIIRDKETKEIWFVGRLYEPNLWENDKKEYKETMFF